MMAMEDDCLANKLRRYSVLLEAMCFELLIMPASKFRLVGLPGPALSESYGPFPHLNLSSKRRLSPPSPFAFFLTTTKNVWCSNLGGVYPDPPYFFATVNLIRKRGDAKRIACGADRNEKNKKKQKESNKTKN
eukprot:GHVT01066653.1.p1 GENE.GHVT01066653.1~~GHVT01066653.1.p1  ORF type:complete len:133 (-),score=10.47 GHVT01066653.1:267-665(-)